MASLHRKAGFADKGQGGQNTTHRVDAAAAVEVTDVGIWVSRSVPVRLRKSGCPTVGSLVPRQFSKRTN